MAAAGTDSAGRLEVREQSGLLLVSATDPALAFLSTVSGIGRHNLADAVQFAGSPTRPVLLTSPDLGVLPGLARGADRGLAIRSLDGTFPPEPDVIEADVDVFVRTLLAGYEVDGPVAAFIEAEHRIPDLRRYLVLEDGTPIAASGMTIHEDVAVLGGASTLPAHRGKRAQPRLLRHRLHVAAALGCTLAVATVTPDSVSVANLAAAGFAVTRRRSWSKVESGVS